VATLDLTLSLIGVAGAVVFLVWRIGLQRERKKPCHPTTSDAATKGAAVGNVVIGGGLAKGLEAARKRQQPEG
jgi:hypothetical protein